LLDSSLGGRPIISRRTSRLSLEFRFLIFQLSTFNFLSFFASQQEFETV
jgi:hypothetical protein